jgi:hypothetical protein
VNAPHVGWCPQPGIDHPACRLLVKVVDVTAEVRIMVDLFKAAGVPTLVTVTVDRGPRRSLIPLGPPPAAELGAALTLAAQMAREV